MSELKSEEQQLGDIEGVARKHCARLLRSAAARRDPKGAEALVILAFTFGAAWALDRPDMIELAGAQMDGLKELKQ